MSSTEAAVRRFCSLPEMRFLKRLADSFGKHSILEILMFGARPS